MNDQVLPLPLPSRISWILRGILLLFALTVMSCPAPAGTEYRKTVTVNGVERAYLLYVPDNVASRPAVIFSFHGLGGTKEQQARMTDFNSHADASGFLVITPDGISKAWDVQNIDPAVNKDVLFVQKMLDVESANYHIDPARVFATGFSMGAYFTHLLAKSLFPKIAAIAPHSGGLGILAVLGINAARKYPALIIHGDADRIVPVQQGRQARDMYIAEGHPTRYIEVKGLGHSWAHVIHITDTIVDFFLNKTTGVDHTAPASPVNLTVFPNPIDRSNSFLSASLRLKTLASRKAGLHISDMTGRSTTVRKSLDLRPGENTIRIPVHTLPPGAYIISVVTRDGLASRTFFVF